MQELMFYIRNIIRKSGHPGARTKCFGSTQDLLRYCIVTVFIACSSLLPKNTTAQSIATDLYNRGFEDGNNTGAHWLVEPFGTGTPVYNSATRRTGQFAGSLQTNSTTAHVWRNNSISVTVPAGQWAHMIGWVSRGASSNVARYSFGLKGGAAPYNNGSNKTPQTTFTQDSYTFQNTTLLPVAYTPYFRSLINSGSTSVTIYYDDIVVYTSNSNTVDLTKPSAASCLSASRTSTSAVTLQWRNGTDAGGGATGVQGTLVLRLNGSSGVAPTLNDQGTYTSTAAASDGIRTIGSWTIIADVPSTSTSYTDASVSPGVAYRYTVIHYDKALNYSNGATPLNVTASAPAAFPNISQSIQNISKPTGGTFTPGDVVQLNVIVDLTGTTIYNLKTRINIDSKFQYVPNSMKITDNKGAAFSDPGTPPAGSCYSYLAPSSATSYTDGSGNDRGTAYSGYVEILLGELPSGQTFAQLEAGTNKLWGGRVRGATIPTYYDFRSIVMASIQVRIPAGTAVGEVFDLSSSTSYSFSEISDASGLTTYNIDGINNPSRFVQLVVSDPTLPASYSSRGANLFSLYNNGTFSGGTDTTGPAVLSSSDLLKVNVSRNAPGDGTYAVVKNTSGTQTITNNGIAINDTNRIFTHLYILGDHTNATDEALGNAAVAKADSGGYMLLVNADYVPTRVVNQTLTSLCPGTFYNFKAWFRNICPSCGVNSNTGDNIRNTNPLDTDPRRQGGKPSLTFDVNNQAYYTTGPIDTSDRWIQKEFVFSTGASSGDFNFSIRNNAPGGDGNDWVLDDISIITRGPSATVNADAAPFVDPEPASFCSGQRFQLTGNWIENTGGFTQYDSYQFQYAYGPTGPWNAITSVGEIPTPNDPYNANGRIADTVTDQFLVNNQDVYFRVVVATQPSNISLADAAPCQITAYNSAVIRIGTCVLPIKLLRFKAASFGQQVYLNWAAAEINRLQYYVIERSTNGVDFSPVSQVDAKAYASPYQYQLIDQPNTSSEQLWYRLKMVHINNEVTYSNIETVGWKKSALSLSIQPNPARDVVHLNWSGVKPNQKVQLTIHTVSGSIVYSKTITIEQGPTQTLRLPALPAGLYILQVEDPTSQYRQTIKLNKL